MPALDHTVSPPRAVRLLAHLLTLVLVGVLVRPAAAGAAPLPPPPAATPTAPGAGTPATTPATTPAGVAPGVPAPDPIAAAQTEAVRLTALLDYQGTALEQAAERYNATRQAADEATERSVQADADLVLAVAREGAARLRLRDAAVSSYITSGQGHLSSTLGAADGGDYTVRRHYVEIVAGAHAHVVDDLTAARSTREQAVAASRDAAAEARAAETKAKADADTATAAQAETQATLARVQGQLADLVAARQAQEQAANRAQWLAAHQPVPPASAPDMGADSANGPAVAPVPGPPGTPTGAGASNGAGAAPGAAAPVPVPPPSTKAAVAIAAAQAQLGKPYLWGGNGPDAFDCSGLTLWAWRAAGARLPRVAADQKAATIPVTFEQLAPGDLVFFGDDTHHVGIYVGNETMINAPHTGDVVRYSSIWWSDLAGFGRVVTK